MCKYELIYFDYVAGKDILFKCSERDVEDGFCVFHHPEYWKKNPLEILQELDRKVKLAVRNNETLFCLGYNLPDITLSGKIDRSMFVASKFHGKTVFEGTEFVLTDFSRAVFDYANFRRTKFFDANLRGARFVEADFSEVTFGEANFNDAAFREVDFSLATFGKAYFFDLNKIKGKRRCGSDPILYFDFVDFCNPEEVHFNAFDLSNTSFLDTDVSRIDIGEMVRWSAKKLLDEKLADEGQIPYEAVATVFRRLRQNLESRLRYVEAGRFFVAEMEMRRKNVGTKNRVLRWLRTNIFSALAWYKYFSNYGESYQRLVPWIVFTPLGAAFLATLVTGPLLEPSQLITFFQEYYQSYIYAFFQLKTDNMAELIIRVLSLLFIGQLYVALRRQFERRYKTSKD